MAMDITDKELSVRCEEHSVDLDCDELQDDTYFPSVVKMTEEDAKENGYDSEDSVYTFDLGQFYCPKAGDGDCSENWVVNIR